MKSESIVALAVIGAALIVGSAIVSSQFVAKYQIAAFTGADGNPFVWRLNARTGAIQSCGFSKDDDPIATPKFVIRCYGESSP